MKSLFGLPSLTLIILLRAAQWLAYGLLAGLALRWAFGRRLFPLVVVIAHAPLALFIWFEASRGRFVRLAT